MTIEVQRWEDKFEIKPGFGFMSQALRHVKSEGRYFSCQKQVDSATLFLPSKNWWAFKAARLHLKSDFFAVVDIKQFFSQRAVVVSPVI